MFAGDFMKVKSPVRLCVVMYENFNARSRLSGLFAVHEFLAASSCILLKGFPAQLDLLLSNFAPLFSLCYNLVRI